MKREGMTLLAFTLALPTLAFAQSGSIVAPVRVPTAQGERVEIARTAGVESKTTTGRPYSAEAVTERVQVLGDGTRIENRSTTRIYRDGEGRIRREMYNTDGSLRSIAISDPVANVSYTLDPASRLAYRTSGNVLTPSLAPAASGAGQARVVSPAPAPAPAPAPVTAGGGGGGVRLMRTPGSDDPNRRTEDLGTKNVEGVMAIGSRTTTVIPLGQIGNTREIRITSEQWFSEELQVLVMTRHADPRSGENLYQLRNILRAEPDPSLFTVPSDYTIQQRGIRRPQ